MALDFVQHKGWSDTRTIQLNVMYKLWAKAQKAGGDWQKFDSIHAGIKDQAQRYKSPKNIDVALKQFSDKELAFLYSKFWLRQAIRDLQIVAAGNGGMIVSKRGYAGGYRRTTDKAEIERFTYGLQRTVKNAADTADKITRGLNSNPNYQLHMGLFELDDPAMPDSMLEAGDE